jgi:Predicted membrane protein
MEAYLFDWLNLLGRWLHVIVGIAWIGASFYFVWLDNHLLPPTDPALRERGVGGELWAVHGGGVYNAQKYAVAPQVLPELLHWFKWEAYCTWLSGVFLLCLVYYLNADVYLIDRAVADIAPATAIAIGLGTLAGGWLVYDRLCVVLANRPRALAAAVAALLAFAAWGLCHVFSGRGAYIHFGALLGTLMVGNVFFVIIPGQRALVGAARAGRAVDPVHGLRGKQRSLHNTYFTLPVIFTMLSNHYAALYNAPHNWLVLLAITAAGAAIRVWFVSRHKTASPSPLPLLAAIALLAATAFALAPQKAESRAGQHINFAQAQAIVDARCVACHAVTPTQPGFAAAPKGVMFDTPERILAQTAQMQMQVASHAMPIGNLTHMTDAERAALLDWIARGAPRD